MSTTMLLLSTWAGLLLTSRPCAAMTPQWKPGGVHWKEEDSLPINLLDIPHVDTSLPPTRQFTITVRGGSSRKSTKSVFASTTEYWSNLFQKAKTSVTQKVSSIAKKPRFLKSASERRSDELLVQLQTTPVRHVTAPNSTVLPSNVIDIAAKRSGLLGRPLNSESIQVLAQSIRQYYERKGFVLHTVTGATLQVDTETAELTVEEPISSNKPVEIIYCKEMVIDDDDGTLTTFRRYRDKHRRLKTLGQDQLSKATVNTTFVPGESGKTSPKRIAQTLGLKPGQPFCWKPKSWSAVQQSGLFSNVLRASPERLQDGTVQLQVYVIEAPPRNLEYGMGKNGFNGAFEGEIVFTHKNLLGGGESLGITARRGRKDVDSSIKVQFKDNKFGMPGGYEVDCFSDYVGEHLEDEEATGEDYDHDDLLVRRGVSFMLQNPIAPTVMRHSSATACLERTSTKGGRHENVASSSFNLGPMTKELPLDARTNVVGKMTVGSRVSTTDDAGWKLLPFSTVTATTQQAFPLANIADNRPVVLALQHSVTGSTRGLPRHVANANGIASRIRGFKDSGRVSSSVAGTTELRIPVPLLPSRLRQDAAVVIFGDWSLAQQTASSAFSRQTSVGVSFRKSLQGIPLKFDVSYTNDGKVDTALGFGIDFQV